MKLVFSGISIMWLGVVTFLSLMNPTYNEASLFPNSDKAVHFLMYGIMAIFFLSRLQLEDNISQQLVILIAVISVVIFGGILEIAQELFTATRQASFWDFLANGLGALAAAVAYKRWLWTPIGKNFAVAIPKGL
jgi:VanZ family protein